jgi:hypothetical protein
MFASARVCHDPVGWVFQMADGEIQMVLHLPFEM